MEQGVPPVKPMTPWMTHSAVLDASSTTDVSLDISARSLTTVEVTQLLLPSCCAYLTSLNFSSNQCDHLPNLSSLQLLKHLNISYNFISSNDPCWELLPLSITSLNMSSNLCTGHGSTRKLSHLPTSLARLKLLDLDVSDNDIRDALTAIQTMTSLTKLNLGYNRFNDEILLQNFQKKDDETMNNQEKDTSSMRSSSSSCCWPSLTSLSIRSNTLSPKSLLQVLSFCSTKKLIQLDMSGCMLRRSDMKCGLPSTLFEFTQLTSLDVSDNNLKQIQPGTIGTMTSLLTIDVSKNRLKRIPDDMLAMNGVIVGAWKQGNRHSWRVNNVELERKKEKDDNGNEDGNGKRNDASASHVSKSRHHHHERPVLRVGEFPPIQSQLFPLSTQTLRARLVHYHRIRLPPTSSRAEVMSVICQAMKSGGGGGGFNLRRMNGIPINTKMITKLLNILREINFCNIKNERPSVDSGGYIVIKRKVPDAKVGAGVHATRVVRLRNERLNLYRNLWDTATECLSCVDESFSKIYSDLAVTKNFIGSPHIDKYDRDAQWALSLGEYGSSDGGGGGGEKVGGELCVEESPSNIVAINTYNRFAKMDGRFPHWVNGYQGERYSLVFYRTEGLKVAKKGAICFP
jgi:Leucine-rich repeat (LRR) protein